MRAEGGPALPMMIGNLAEVKPHRRLVGCLLFHLVLEDVAEQARYAGVPFGRAQVDYRTRRPSSTQVSPSTVTVASTKKFQRTYPPPTVPPSSVLSPSESRTTPAP